jgi:DNA-binding NarL/FixJ family response regulator
MGTAYEANIGNIGIMNSLAVAIVEDDPNLLWHYSALIGAEPDMRLAGTATGVQDGLAMMERIRADVLLCDISLHDGNGIDIVRYAAKRHPAINILAVTRFSDNAHVFRAIEAGAVGYLLKDAQPDLFAGTIREVVNGCCLPHTHIARRPRWQRLQATRSPTAVAASGCDDNPLTTRETEILEFLGKGLSFGDVAELLFISAHTVTAHMRNIYQKLSVHSRSKAVYEARQMGLIS